MSKTIARFRFAQSRHHAPGLQADNASRRTSDLAPGSTVESRPVIRAAIADGRRWAAIGLFRLASRGLREMASPAAQDFTPQSSSSSIGNTTT